MLSRTRTALLALVGTLAVCGIVISLVQLARYDHRQQAGATVLAPLAVGTELQRPRPVPAIGLEDPSGRRVSLSAYRGRWVVLAPSMTLCHEVCPMTTAALSDLQSSLRRAGLAKQVVVVEATVDPWRDSTARLRAYRRLTGADFQMLTGSQAAIRSLWRFFGVYYRRVPQGNPPDVDWLTHRPETFDVQHTDAFFLIDPAGQERVIDEGMPSVGGRLPLTLRTLLNAQGRQNLAHPALAWTAANVLEDLYYLMNRRVAASAIRQPGPPTPAAAARELAGSPQTLASLHSAAGRLLPSGDSLLGELQGLRGYPVVVNVWASWCGPCKAEFPLFATASARYGRRVAFLGNDTNDSAGSARDFLAQHPVSYPSTQSAESTLGSLAQILGLPTTIYVNRAGHVVWVHTGSYQTETALEQDIQRYAIGVSTS